MISIQTNFTERSESFELNESFATDPPLIGRSPEWRIYDALITWEIHTFIRSAAAVYCRSFIDVWVTLYWPISHVILTYISRHVNVYFTPHIPWFQGSFYGDFYLKELQSWRIYIWYIEHILIIILQKT